LYYLLQLHRTQERNEKIRRDAEETERKIKERVTEACKTKIIWPSLPNSDEAAGMADEWSIAGLMESSSHYNDVYLPPLSPQHGNKSASTGRPISPIGQLSKQSSTLSDFGADSGERIFRYVSGTVVLADPDSALLATPSSRLSRTKARKQGLTEIMGAQAHNGRNRPSFADLYPKASSETKVHTIVCNFEIVRLNRCCLTGFSARY
jgi:hypothetical protein